MSRVAIIGSCITRDLWPIQGDNIEDLLYISRTSLPSLLARAVPGFAPNAQPPGDLTRAQHRWVVSDLTKQGFDTLLAYRPTHIIFDFIDERFDLLSVGGTLATHSWELEVSGYMAGPPLSAARPAPRLSSGVERLWMDAAAELADLVAATPLRDAAILLHETQWADGYLDASGARRPFETVSVWGDRYVDIGEHNDLLRRYQSAFRQAFPKAVSLSADDAWTADAGHRWGLSPFHYVPEYYEEIWRQLEQAGVLRDRCA